MVWLVARLPVLIFLLTSPYEINVDATSITCDVISTENYWWLYRYPFIRSDVDMCDCRFKCPQECMCTLTNGNMKLACPSGESLLPIEYRDYTSQEDYYYYSYSYSPYTYSKYSSDNFNKYSPSESSVYRWDEVIISKIQYRAFEQVKHLEDLHLVLTHNNISMIEAAVFEGLTNLSGLYLSFNNIGWIEQGAFDDLFNLRYLFLNDNDIPELLSRQFQRLPSLKILNLSLNKITRVDQMMFHGLDNLSILRLASNNIASIDPWQFVSLHNLRTLDLGGNNMAEIHPQQFQQSTDLTSIILDNNNIDAIHPQQFFGLTELKVLSLKHNNISVIHPMQFKDLVNLIELRIDYNNIAVIPVQVFSGLINLMRLFIDNSNIAEIHPQQFLELTHLEVLSLKHNSINPIHPMQFQGLTNLMKLDVEKNNIAEIHSQLFLGLTNLKFLSLKRNRISIIHPLQFTGLINLQRLYIDYNNITAIPAQAFSGLSSLTFLYISHNNIQIFHSEQFEGLTSLVYLFLTSNHITDIDPLQFQGLNNLQYLFFAGNKISQLHLKQFQDNTRLKVLILDKNNITSIHPSLFQGLPLLATLKLDHNSLYELHPQLLREKNSLNALDISYNFIEEIHPGFFKNTTSLIVLALRNNRIANLLSEHFDPLRRLNFLDLRHNNLVKIAFPGGYFPMHYIFLSHNKLRSLPSGILQYIPYLWYLDLSYNNFDSFDSHRLFNHTMGQQITKLDLRGNNLYWVDSMSFLGFDVSTEIMVDNGGTCCFIQNKTCIATIPASQFLTCGRLLPNQVQRVIMWSLGFFAIISNICVLCYKFRQNTRNVQTILICNLSMSDLLMGIYMLVIVSADEYYRDYFPAEAWRVSIPCKLAGTLSVISSEASVFFVTLISIDRLMGIRYPFSDYRIRSTSAKVVAIILWIFAISVSMTLTVVSGINTDFYDVSEVCTGLPLSRSNVFERRPQDNSFVHFGIGYDLNTFYDYIIGQKPGMYFGIGTFIALNMLCFVIVSLCYLVIFVTAIQAAKTAGRDRNHDNERKMAMKMSAIVLTDMGCWISILILSILVQSGRYVVSPHAYTWIVTFVLPINSAINPFMYTLASVMFDITKRKKQPATRVTI